MWYEKFKNLKALFSSIFKILKIRILINSLQNEKLELADRVEHPVEVSYRFCIEPQ